MLVLRREEGHLGRRGKMEPSRRRPKEAVDGLLEEGHGRKLETQFGDDESAVAILNGINPKEEDFNRILYQSAYTTCKPVSLIRMIQNLLNLVTFLVKSKFITTQ